MKLTSWVTIVAGIACAMVIARFTPAIVVDPVAIFANQLRNGTVPTDPNAPVEESFLPSQEYLGKLKNLLKSK